MNKSGTIIDIRGDELLNCESVRKGFVGCGDELKFETDTDVPSALEAVAHAILAKFSPDDSQELSDAVGSDIYIHSVEDYLGRDCNGDRIDTIQLDYEEFSTALQYIMSDAKNLESTPNLKCLTELLQSKAAPKAKGAKVKADEKVTSATLKAKSEELEKVQGELDELRKHIVKQTEVLIEAAKPKGFAASIPSPDTLSEKGYFDTSMTSLRHWLDGVKDASEFSSWWQSEVVHDLSSILEKVRPSYADPIDFPELGSEYLYIMRGMASLKRRLKAYSERIPDKLSQLAKDLGVYQSSNDVLDTLLEKIIARNAELEQGESETEAEHIQALTDIEHRIWDILNKHCREVPMHAAGDSIDMRIRTGLDQLTHYCRTWKKNATNTSEACKGKAEELCAVSSISATLEEMLIGEQSEFGTTPRQRLERIYRHLMEKSSKVKEEAQTEEVSTQQFSMLHTILMLQLIFGKPRKKKKEE